MKTNALLFTAEEIPEIDSDKRNNVHQKWLSQK